MMRFPTPEHPLLLAGRRAWRLLAPSKIRGAACKQEDPWLAAHSHAHPYAEYLVALAGTCRYGVEGRALSVRAGTAVFFEPLRQHQCGYPPCVDRARHLWIALPDDNAFFRELTISRGRMAESGGGQRLLGREELGFSPAEFLAGSAALPSAWQRLKLETLLHMLLVKRMESAALPPPPRGRGTFQRQVVQAMCNHIRGTAGKGQSLDGLAHLSGYSKFHLTRLFQRHAGCTVHEYIDRCRALRMRERQKEGVPAHAIGDELGFSCPAAFSRWHRKHCVACATDREDV